jgi:hypothetical protein
MELHKRRTALREFWLGFSVRRFPDYCLRILLTIQQALALTKSHCHLPVEIGFDRSLTGLSVGGIY